MDFVKVYFAHPIATYGTEESAKTWKWLCNFHGSGNVRNPENLDWRELVCELGSHQAVYQAMINACAEINVLEWNGYVGRGVTQEVMLALDAGKAVWVCRPYAFHRVVGISIVDRNDWALRYATLVVKEER